jgi:hypothetical protein
MKSANMLEGSVNSYPSVMVWSEMVCSLCKVGVLENSNNPKAGSNNTTINRSQQTAFD